MISSPCEVSKFTATPVKEEATAKSKTEPNTPKAGAIAPLYMY